MPIEQNSARECSVPGKEVFLLSDKVLIMNFSGAYELESFAENENFDHLDCSHISGTDCYCDYEAAQKLRSMIADFPVHGIHFIDSGDYHYMTKFWTDRIQRPFSLILFDHHPDMQPPLFGKMLSCGDWVKEVLDHNPFIKKVVIIGAADNLIQDIPSGYEQQVHFYSEHALEYEATWKKFSSRHLDEPVYISIDKDVLSRRDAVTNWDQGSMSLVEMEKLLSVIFEKEEVIGVDICGEFSPVSDVLQEEADAQVDDAVNKELVDFIENQTEG